jgi:hypothetical protein
VADLIYGYCPVGEDFTGFPPFGLLDPSALVEYNYDVMFLAWAAEGSGFVAKFYLSDVGLPAPSNAFAVWSFTDDTGTEWTFNRSEADTPEGVSLLWGEGYVRGWQWTVPDSDLPVATVGIEYAITINAVGIHTEHTHTASELGLQTSEDFSGVVELTALHVHDPSFSQARGTIWVTPSGELYAEGGLVFTPWTADEFPNDQAAEVTLANVSGDATGAIGAAVRVTDAGAYAVMMDGTGVVRVNKYRASGLQKTFASITPSPPLESGDVLRIEAEGSTLTTMINGVVVYQTTDSDHASGTVAVAGYGESALLRAPPPSGSGWKGDNPRKNKVGFAVVPAGATQSTAATSPALALGFIARPNSAQHEHYATEPALVPEVVVIVAPQSVEHAQETGSPALVGGYAVAPAFVESAHIASGPTLALDFEVEVADAEHGQVALELAYHSIVYPSPPEHAHDVTEPILAATNEVGATSTDHVHQVTSPEIVFSRKVVIPADAEHGHKISTWIWEGEEKRPIIYYEVEEEETRYFKVEEQDLITTVPGEEWLAMVAHETMLHVVVREQIRS